LIGKSLKNSHESLRDLRFGVGEVRGSRVCSRVDLK
jgi:hypothetical protein